MSPAGPSLDIVLPAEPRSASVARRAVLDALRGVAVDRAAVSIVVSEAVTNAVIHAYRDDESPGLVHVSARVDDHGVEIAVADDGVGLRPRPDSPGVGFGMPLMADLADHIEMDSGAGGSRVTARFAVLGPAGPHSRPLKHQAAGHAQRRTATLI
jgi:anti-sigma regulatory factor (Ser/Thr protein kinase)